MCVGDSDLGRRALAHAILMKTSEYSRTVDTSATAACVSLLEPGAHYLKMAYLTRALGQLRNRGLYSADGLLDAASTHVAVAGTTRDAGAASSG